MSSIKKVLKKAVDPLGVFASPAVKAPEIKTPAQQLERQAETGVDDITLGTDDELGQAKGKRALLRPTSGSSLGGL